MYSELGITAECRRKIRINVLRDGSPAVMSQESCSKRLVAGVIRRRNGSQTEKPLPRCGGTQQAANTPGRGGRSGRGEREGCFPGKLHGPHPSPRPPRLPPYLPPPPPRSALSA